MAWHSCFRFFLALKHWSWRKLWLILTCIQKTILLVFKCIFAEAMEETYGPTNKGDWDKLLAPNSVFQKLRSVEIHYLKCSENEFDFVEYLLKTASVLENVRITTIKPRSNSKEFKYSEFGRKIQSLPRASSSATLSFVQPI